MAEEGDKSMREFLQMGLMRGCLSIGSVTTNFIELHRFIYNTFLKVKDFK